MKIYILTVNKIHEPRSEMISSSYVAHRTKHKEEFYLKKESAEKRLNEIYDGVSKLTGFIDNVEVLIKEVEVIE